MKYFNFLKVTLIIGVIINFISASAYFTGSIYDKYNLKAADIYSRFPEMKTGDISYGIIMILFSIFQLYVRTQLAMKTKKAPTLITVLHAISLVPGVLYDICTSQIIDNTSSALPSFLAALIISPIFAFITYKYFSKRSFLFIN